MASPTILSEARNVQITGGIFNSVSYPSSRSEDADQPDGKANLTTEKKINKKKWKVWLKPGDEIPKFGKPDDLIIPVMGAAGTGKSTFINALLGKEEAKVGHSFYDGTRILQQFSLSIPDKFRELQHRRLVIVDTPGFDDVNLSDQEILRRVAVWLACAYMNGMKIAGIIYLYDISQSRLHPSTMRNTEIFRRLCGEDALSGVVLVTTKWGIVREEDGIAREESYCKDLWKDLISAGSAVNRFHGTQNSAFEIISRILLKFQNTHNVDALQIQLELVDLVRHIPETSAGRALRLKVSDLYKLQKKRCTTADLSIEDKQKIEDLINQAKNLNIAISRRILIFFGFADL